MKQGGTFSFGLFIVMAKILNQVQDDKVFLQQKNQRFIAVSFKSK